MALWAQSAHIYPSGTFGRLVTHSSCARQMKRVDRLVHEAVVMCECSSPIGQRPCIASKLFSVGSRCTEVLAEAISRTRGYSTQLFACVSPVTCVLVLHSTSVARRPATGTVALDSKGRCSLLMIGCCMASLLLAGQRLLIHACMDTTVTLCVKRLPARPSPCATC